MPTATKSNSNVESLQERHARLVKSIASLTGADKAVAAKRIGDTEYEMELASIEYTPWERPSSYTQKWTLSASELVERIAKARALADDPSKRDLIRERATKDLDKLTAQAEKRGMTIPDA
jgi:hypothetical protein